MQVAESKNVSGSRILCRCIMCLKKYDLYITCMYVGISNKMWLESI